MKIQYVNDVNIKTVGSKPELINVQIKRHSGKKLEQEEKAWSDDRKTGK